jgi:hypothetical protein
MLFNGVANEVSISQVEDGDSIKEPPLTYSSWTNALLSVWTVDRRASKRTLARPLGEGGEMNFFHFYN